MDIVIGQFEDVNLRDFAAALDPWAEDMTLIPHGDMMGIFGRVGTGKEAVAEWFGDLFRDHDWQVEIEESRDLGDRVFIIATHHVHGRPAIFR